jgi:hypothetical protein
MYSNQGFAMPELNGLIVSFQVFGVSICYNRAIYMQTHTTSTGRREQANLARRGAARRSYIRLRTSGHAWCKFAFDVSRNERKLDYITFPMTLLKGVKVKSKAIPVTGLEGP